MFTESASGNIHSHTLLALHCTQRHSRAWSKQQLLVNSVAACHQLALSCCSSSIGHSHDTAFHLSQPDAGFCVYVCEASAGCVAGRLCNALRQFDQLCPPRLVVASMFAAVFCSTASSIACCYRRPAPVWPTFRLSYSLLPA